MATWQQWERQRTRGKNGKYTTLNACEFCGKSAGANHCSLEGCNETGEGVCVCTRKSCRESEIRSRARRNNLMAQAVNKVGKIVESKQFGEGLARIIKSASQ